MGIPEPYKPPPTRERKDPTEWVPEDNRDYEAVNAVVDPVRMSVDPPLRYQSLEGHDEEQVRAIEQTALANLRADMNRLGMHPDERSLRTRWELHVTGLGYRAPEGFIHPEAPEDIQRESQAAWKRCVEIATDSLSNSIFVRVWRRRSGVLAQAGQKVKVLDRAERKEISASEEASDER